MLFLMITNVVNSFSHYPSEKAPDERGIRLIRLRTNSYVAQEQL